LGWMFESWDFFVGCLCGCKTPLLHGHDLSRPGFNSPGGNVYMSMFLDLVYVCVSHLYQNVDMATHLANKSTNVLKHLKPILMLS
jgi:hypothetical protein